MNMNWKTGLLCVPLCVGFLVTVAASPEVPGPKQKQAIAIVGATVHPISGESIDGGIVLFDQGKIVAIGKDVEIPDGAQRIDASGKHVFPGLFDAHTDMGLVEINSIRATIDNGETGSMNPNVKSWVSVNPDSEVIPVTRSNGVLLALSAPSGGFVAGRSAVLQLDGWTYEDLTVRSEIGMHVNWPAMRPSRRDVEQSAGEPQNRESPLKPLREFWDKAQAYQKARKADAGRHSVDARLEAMLPVLEQRLPLIVTADDLRQIQSAVAFTVEKKVRLILHGGYDAAECAPLLKQHDIPVIVSGTYRLPQRDSDPYDAAYTLPDRLRKAGVKFCIASSGRFGASGVRNLPYHATTAVAFGLPADEALKAITLYPARILGVAERIGSLEVGRDATLFISTGNPLDTETQVESVFIQGRLVELNDRHKRLWKKYEEKYRRAPE